MPSYKEFISNRHKLAITSLAPSYKEFINDRHKLAITSLAPSYKEFISDRHKLAITSRFMQPVLEAVAKHYVG